MAKTNVYSVYKDRGAYWIVEDGVAITGDLEEHIAIEDLTLFVNAVNALHDILNEIPENAKLPLTLKIKELAEKGLKRR